MRSTRFRVSVLTIVLLAIAGAATTILMLATGPAEAHNNHPTPSLSQMPLCEEVLNGDAPAPDSLDDYDIGRAHTLETGYYCYKHTIRKNTDYERVVTVAVLTKPFDVPWDGADGDWLAWQFGAWFSPGVIAKDDGTTGECGTSKVVRLWPKSAMGSFGLQHGGSSTLQGSLNRPDERYRWRTKGPSSEYPRGSKI